jgi:hypothetical protein
MRNPRRDTLNKKISEDIMKEVALKMSDIIVVVLNELSWNDQVTYIHTYIFLIVTFHRNIWTLCRQKSLKHVDWSITSLLCIIITMQNKSKI